MKKGLPINKWMLFWELYDQNAWANYLFNPNIQSEYKQSKFSLKSYLHDGILVPAIEQIEYNLSKIDPNTKFLYWFRFREEFLIISEDVKIVDIAKMDVEIKPIYQEYTKDWKRKPWGHNKLPTFEYFKWFYFSIYDLKGTALMFLHEVLFDLPIVNNIDVNKKNIENIKANRLKQNISIHNYYGNIETLINSFTKKQNYCPDRKVKPNGFQIVESIITNFKNQIENNGLYRLLYDSKDKKLRNEKTAQQLFFSVSQIFCLANDLDLSPEVNSGMG